MDYKIFLKKVLPVIFILNCFYIWVSIVLGTLQIFGSNIIGMFIGLISISINCYVHIKAYIAIQEENEKQP